jgi:hypothetical protein
MTNSGPDTMNSGAPTTGSSSESASDAGNGIQSSLRVSLATDQPAFLGFTIGLDGLLLVYNIEQLYIQQ